MIYWTPFKSKFSFYSAVIAETNFLLICVTMFSFVDNNETILRYIGWGNISMIITSLSCSWVCTLMQQIRSYRRLAQLALKKTKDNVYEGNNTPEIEADNNNNVSIDKLKMKESSKGQQNILQNQMSENPDEIIKAAKDREISDFPLNDQKI